MNLTSQNNKLRGYIVLAAIFIVLSVISFAAPFVKNPCFWIAYIFGLCAIAFQVYVFHLSFSGGRDVKSKFYGFPIARIGVFYLIAQLCLTLLEMILAFFLPYWIPLILNVVLGAFALVGCVAADVMRDEIIYQEDATEKNISNMRSLQAFSMTLADQCDHVEAKKYLKTVAEKFRFSDPVSSNETLELESKLKVLLNEIQQAVVENDFDRIGSLSTKTMHTLAERNRRCKLAK